MPVFEFVDAGDPTARTRAKSHVARKAHRERRLREIEAYQTQAPPAPRVVSRPSRATVSTPITPQLGKPSRQLPVRNKVLQPPPITAQPAVLTPPDTEPDADDDVPPEGDSDKLDTYASRVAARPHDAFWTVYSQLDSGDRNLLQWYLFTVPELSFAVSHTASLNPMRDWIFPLVGESGAVLNSSLLIGAVNNPDFFHGDKGVSRVLIQKGKTISLINQALQKGPEGLKDDILYAVAATAIAEDRLGNQSSCRTHLDGLQHMIRLRGGIKSLRKNTALCAAVVWAEVSVKNFAAPRAHPQDYNATSKISTIAMFDAQHEEQMFCHFLTRLQRVQLDRRRAHDSLDNISCQQTDYLFRRGSALLAILGDADQDSGVITPISKLNVNNCQLLCLFYINCMLCEFHGSVQLSVNFLVQLSTLVRRHSQNKVPRASLFVWVFIHELEQDDSPGGTDRIEWLIQMIRVARRLSPESSQMLHRALIESLKSHEPLDAGVRVSNDLGILASRIEIGSF